MFATRPEAFETATPVTLTKALGHRPAKTPRRQALSGLVAGTLVETETGWRPVETLRRGDRVETYDGGLQAVRALAHRPVSAGAVAARGLLHVPGGALDNCEEFWLLDAQNVMIESAVAERMLGTPTVLVPGLALEGYRGIERLFGGRPTEVISLSFDDEELVYANTGVLFHCPPTAPATAGKTGFFTALGAERARALLALIAADPAQLPDAFARLDPTRLAA